MTFLFISQAYLEFFTSKENVDILMEILNDYPQVNYHIMDSEVGFILYLLKSVRL